MTASRFHHLTRHILHSNRLSIGIFVAAWIFIVSVVLGGEAPKDTASTTSNYYGYGYGYGYDGGSKETGDVDTGASIKIGCTVDNATITQIIQLRTAYYTNMYADQNAQLAAQKIANIKDVVYQACGYDLDNPTSEALVLQREQKINGCESDYQRYNAAYIEYIKGGNISLASQLKQIIDAVDANGGCAEGDKTIGSAYFANAGDVHPVGIARSMGAAICDNTDFVFSYVQQIKGFTSTDRIDAVVANFEDLIQQADANSLLDKEELLFIVKAIAESHGGYLRGEGGGIMNVNVSTFCKTIKGEFESVQLISSLDDYKSAEDMTFDGATEKRYRQISLVAGDTIYFNFLIDGNPIDETPLGYTADEDGTYTVTFDPTSPRTINIRRIDDAVEDAYDEITRQRLMEHFSVINTTIDLSTMATKLGHYELASQLGSVNGDRIEWLMSNGDSVSKEWVAQYVIDNRPVGGWEGNGGTASDWLPVAALAEEAMTARIAGLLTLINDATSPGFGTSVDISFSYNQIAASTRVDGEMMYPWTDFFVSNDWRPLSDYSVLTAVEKQYMLEYVYANKPYATVTELSQAVAQGRQDALNMRYISYFNTINTTTSTAAMSQQLGNYELANYLGSVNGDRIEWLMSNGDSVSKEWVAQYVIDNRPVGGWEGNGGTASDWLPVAALAEEAMTARIDLLMYMINNATSAGIGLDISPTFSYNQIAASTRVDGEMIYPFMDFFISNDWRPLSDYNILTPAERQYMVDYVYSNRPYNTLSEIQAAAQQGSNN